jgi:hypothetical protein
VFLGLLVLPVGVMVRRLQVVMCRRVVVRRRNRVVLDGRMLGLFWHGCVLLGVKVNGLAECAAAVGQKRFARAGTLRRPRR